MASPAHASPLISEADRRRRRRPQLSCVLCRRRKVKCNRELPCDQCYKLSKGRSCVYNDIIPSAETPDHGALSSNSVDPSRSAPQRSPFESNTGLRRSREHNAPPRENILRTQGDARLRDGRPVSSHATSILASPGISRTASTQEAVSSSDQPFSQSSSITVHGDSEVDETLIDSSTDQPSLNFIEDGWMTEFHGESHWSTVLKMV